MKLPREVRDQFRKHGRTGGLARAARMTPAARREVARKAAAARWMRHRFGASSFEEAGLPGGDLVDAGLADLAARRVSIASLLVSLAAPRLRREGVVVGPALENPERRLYEELVRTAHGLAHARYNAYLRRISSFANACRVARRDRPTHAR